ncbi:MAG TPA: hypothetical protein ENN03_11780, partial [bacterium]|nr:hypothetical protein [bacterium]
MDSREKDFLIMHGHRLRPYVGHPHRRTRLFLLFLALFAAAVTVLPAVSLAASWTFLVYGDSQSIEDVHRTVLNKMVNKSPEPRFMINCGDVVVHGYEQTRWENWKATCEDVLPGWGEDWEGLGQGLNPPKYMACPGNHDELGTADGLNNWQTYLWGQYQQWGNNGKYFWFDYENARFIILDSESSSLTGTQKYMLTEALRSNHKTWIFVFWHRPIFNFSTKTPHPHKYEEGIHNEWGIPLYDYGCDIIFNGHAHYYVRTKKLKLDGAQNPPLDAERGTTQVVTGNGGAALMWDFNENQDGNKYMLDTWCNTEHGYTEVTVSGNQLRLRHILRYKKDINGTYTDILDEKTFTANPKGGPAPAEPDIDISPASHDYGDVMLGQSSSRSFTVENKGGENLHITATELTGTHAADFGITSGGGARTLPPG